MKIALINKSDSTGGAAIFTYRLMKAFRQSNVDAKLLVVEKLTTDEHVVSYAAPLKDKIAFLAERLQIFLSNRLSRKTLFKVDTGHFGRDISTHPLLREADVIILNWTNQGCLSNAAIRKICQLHKPVLWNMHDMWCATGICHHAYDCTHYHHHCGQCPNLHSASPTDLSHSVWKSKHQLYQQHPNLHFVSVSNWLAQKCELSSLLRSRTVSIIPNTCPISDYTHHRRSNEELHLPTGKKILTLGAARLDDPIKGLPLLIQALKAFITHYPAEVIHLHLLLYGDIKDNRLLRQLPIPHTYLGRIPQQQINNILTHTDLVLSTSHYESFGGTLVEALASGCIPVSFNNGGQTDIIDHKLTGYLANYPDTTDFAHGIHWALHANIPRVALHQSAHDKFSPQSVAAKYLSLIAEINS